MASRTAISFSQPGPGNGTLVKALARAWRWQKLLDEGVYTSVSEIGDAENISKSYVCRILRLALLAPDIVEAILAGEHGSGADAGEAGAAAAGELDGAAPTRTQRTHLLKRAARRPDLHASPQSRRRRNVFRGRPPLEILFYFLLPAVAAPGFGFASAFGTVLVDATIFFLSALGFLASRLLLF